MTTTAKVMFFKNEFIASLSDGRRIERRDWREMALALYSAGVEGGAVDFEWGAGQRMITAGQQVALQAEIRRLARTEKVRIVAAT